MPILMQVASLLAVALALSMADATPNNKFLQKPASSLTDARSNYDSARGSQRNRKLNNANATQTGRALEVFDCKDGPVDSCGWPLTTDFGTEISCTPFPLIQAQSDCKRDQLGPAGENGFAQGWAYLDCDADPSDDKCYDDFFVFHGCDGAGLQTDCIGAQDYFEHFGPIIDFKTQATCACVPTEAGNACNDGISCLDYTGQDRPEDAFYFVPCDPQTEDEKWHTQCQFTHPGTGVSYSNYLTGQLANVPGPYKDLEGTDDARIASNSNANIKCDDLCPACFDEAGHCYTDYTSCGLDAGEEPQFEDNPFKLGDTPGYYEYTFWGRKELWVCHNDNGEDLSRFTGTPFINCLSDNEVKNAVRGKDGPETPIANPWQVFFYAGIYKDADGKRVMDVQDYDYCGNKQGESFSLQEISF